MLSCTTSKFEEGSYRINSVTHVKGKSIVTFEGYNREFILPTDTLKKGDVVYLIDPRKYLKEEEMPASEK